MRGLAHHLFRHRESERARIAREIHNEFGGALSIIKLEVSQAVADLEFGDDELRRRLQRAGDLADTAISSLRRLITELRPTVLDDLGLASAIDWLGREFSRRHRIACRVLLPDTSRPIDNDRAVAMFRIAQEALSNIARHARATGILIELDISAGAMRLLIADNGVGLPADPQTRPNAHGLRGADELAHSLGGEVRVASATDGGALLIAELPLEGAKP